MVGFLELFMGIIAFTIFVLIVYLSTLSWYEREEEESVYRGLKIGVALGFVLSFAIVFLLDAVSPDIGYVYANFILVSFVLSIIVLYPLITWVRKRIYYYFYLAAYLAYNVLSWYLFSLFLYFVLGMDAVTTIVASYLVGAVIGTLLATAVIKEIRPREIIFGGLSAVITAISIADFGTRLLSHLLPPIIIFGGIGISWVLIFLVVSIAFQMFYYKLMVNR